MAVHFSFFNFVKLIEYNIGIAERFDSNTKEEFTILFVDFGDIDTRYVKESLEKVLRGSDVVVNYENYYFFILQATDKFGGEQVVKLFEDFLNATLNVYTVSYTEDGESEDALISSLLNGVYNKHAIDLEFLKEKFHLDVE